MNKEIKNGGEIYFDRINYICLVSGILLIALGYILMTGGKSEDPNVFNPEVFSARRITVAPITCLIGFAVIVYAIMRRPKQNSNQSEA